MSVACATQTDLGGDEPGASPGQPGAVGTPAPRPVTQPTSAPATAVSPTQSATAVSPTSGSGTPTTGSPLAAIAPPTCDDGERNGDELGIDCGGTCEAQACPLGSFCNTAADCSEGSCVAVPSLDRCPSSPPCSVCSACDNGVHDTNETDIDCGGQACGRCALGQACLVDEDCDTFNCQAGACVASNNPLIVFRDECECHSHNPNNPGDEENCLKYVDCYVENGCEPETCSANGDQPCGVNKVGTGAEFVDAAQAFYDCAMAAAAAAGATAAP